MLEKKYSDSALVFQLYQRPKIVTLRMDRSGLRVGQVAQGAQRSGVVGIPADRI